MAKLKDKLKPAIDVAPAVSPAPIPTQQFNPVKRNTPTPGSNQTTITTATGGKKYQERIPGTNTIKEYDETGKLIYFGGNDPETRMAVEQANQKQLSQQQAISQQEQSTQLQQGVGQLDANMINEVDPLTQSIAGNLEGQANYNKIVDYSGTPQENFNRNTISLLSRVAPAAVKILNRVSFNTNLGTGIVNELSEDEDVKRIMNGFDNTENVKQVRENLVRAEGLKTYALGQAKIDPIKAKQNYQLYLSLKKKSLGQMKALSRDPKKFDELRLEIQLLNDYFDPASGIKAMDDEAMMTALNMG